MASSSDGLMEHIAREFTEIALCSICTEVFANPRLLACRHTFCLECLKKYAEEKHCGQKIACPICRQTSIIPTGGLVNLERNRDMERLVETSRRVELRLKKGVYHCDVHAGKPVMFYCETCSCPVCLQCITDNHSSHRFQEPDTAADESVKQLETKLGYTVNESLRKLEEKLQIISVHQKAVDENQTKVLDHYKEIEALIVANRHSLLSELHAAKNELLELKGDTDDGGRGCGSSVMPVTRSALTDSSCYSENVARSMFGTSAVTDEQFESGVVQPVSPDWCSCCYCEPMTQASERRCCASICQVLHVCESANAACITQLPDFHVNCLSLTVIHLAFCEQHEKTREQLPKPIHEIYRDLACVRFRRWIYRVPRGHVTNGVPACALNHIRQTFAPESACSFTYPR